MCEDMGKPMGASIYLDWSWNWVLWNLSPRLLENYWYGGMASDECTGCRDWYVCVFKNIGDYLFYKIQACELTTQCI